VGDCADARAQDKKKEMAEVARSLDACIA